MKRMLPKYKFLFLGILFLSLNLPIQGLGQLTPFPCSNGIAYQVAGSPESGLYSYNIVTGVRTPVAATLTPLVGVAPNIRANAIGLNPKDKMLWGWEDQSLGQVIRIDAAGKFEAFTIPNLPPIIGSSGTPYNCGEVLPDGYLILYATNASQFYTIDIDPIRVNTYLQLVDPNTKVKQTAAPFGTTLSQAIVIHDFAYNPTSGLLQSIISGTSGNTADRRKMVTIDPITGQVAMSTNPIASQPGAPTGQDFNSEGAFGAAFVDGNNNFFAFANTTGNFYRINTVTGIATYLSTTTTSGNNDGASCPNTILAYAIQGTVFNDPNGLLGTPVNTIDGTSTNIGNALYMVLYNNTTGKVEDRVAVKTDGSFDLAGFPGSQYTLYLTTAAVTIGQSAVPTIALPTGWVHTGEFADVGPGTDGTIDGILSLTALSADKTNLRFGVEQVPTATNYTLPPQGDPGGTNNITVPGAAFTGSDVGGTIERLTITQFPTNATSITIGSNTYTTITAIQTAFPSGIPTNPDGTPTLVIQVDPDNGSSNVLIPYKLTDNAGFQSLEATVTIDLTTILPVRFGVIEAIIKGHQLSVNWSSISEVNNDHFEIEASFDGVHFKKIGEVSSMAENGNSDMPITYTFSKSVANITLAGALLAFLLAAGSLYFPKKGIWFTWVLAFLSLGLALTIFSACNKPEAGFKFTQEDLYIRIVQVDKQSTKTSTSKIIKAVHE